MLGGSGGILDSGLLLLLTMVVSGGRALISTASAMSMLVPQHVFGFHHYSQVSRILEIDMEAILLFATLCPSYIHTRFWIFRGI